MPLGLGVARGTVFLPDAEAAQLVLQAVAAALPPDRRVVNTMPLNVGQGGGRDAVLLAGGAEGQQHGEFRDHALRYAQDVRYKLEK